ncbi:hypothetical protein PMIN01_13352 [Paraphaeosphaeria minitans]|uniref:PNPLA domain-containing protein n=1 Tax=Paraphaeosphaeria minitans TaxID=565426 RepID=A0A9P6G694_9PLEO|nr:hypothetical protein PMIN01_13352 [Paraphaeosphaeria minitans]
MTAFAAPFIAGCLALDNYAYDVPYFGPEEVFAAHYRRVCVAATENKTFKCSGKADTPVFMLRTGAVSLIEQHFLTNSRHIKLGREGRSKLMSEFRPWLCRLKTYKSCLTCMQRAPEHKFPCGHMVCEECCKALGRHFDTDPHLYVFDHCPICELPCKVALRVKPVTAGFRVLSIDGGGIRAVIPIQFLRALEQAIGLDMPVQEHFDLSYGTSSGSMVNLALYGLGTKVSEASDLFKQLSTRVFRGRSRIGVGLAATLQALVVSYRNGRFPAGDIDGALSDVFSNATMLDHPYMSSIGARTGFPIVNADTSETCMVTSYNGAARGRDLGDCNGNTTYRVLRSHTALDEILVKDAARCASAAPWYFTPHSIPYHGTFIDGGLSDNNPCMLAMQELQRMAPELRRPDQFVSVGTGASRASQATATGGKGSFLFGNNSLRQTFKHYWSENFDGDKKFASMRHMMAATVPDGTGNIDGWLRRFNLSLEEELPDLADARVMDDLANAAWALFTSDPALHDLARAVLASSFYFELRCMPMYENGYYTCCGRILCRIPVTKPAFTGLMQKLDAMGAHFLLQKRTAREIKPTAVSFDQTGNFSKPVSLRVRDLEEPLDVRLRFSGTRGYHISASPVSIDTLIKQQKLEWASLSHTGSGYNSPTKKKRPSVGNVYAKALAMGASCLILHGLRARIPGIDMQAESPIVPWVLGVSGVLVLASAPHIDSDNQWFSQGVPLFLVLHAGFSYYFGTWRAARHKRRVEGGRVSMQKSNSIAATREWVALLICLGTLKAGAVLFVGGLLDQAHALALHSEASNILLADGAFIDFTVLPLATAALDHLTDLKIAHKGDNISSWANLIQSTLQTYFFVRPLAALAGHDIDPKDGRVGIGLCFLAIASWLSLPVVPRSIKGSVLLLAYSYLSFVYVSRTGPFGIHLL